MQQEKSQAAAFQSMSLLGRRRRSRMAAAVQQPLSAHNTTIRPSPNVDPQKLQVLRSLRLVHAFCRLTLNQYRLLMAMASLVDPRGEYPEGNIRIEMSAAEISRITGIDVTNLKKTFLEKAGEAFTSTPIKSYNEDTGHIEFIPIATKSSIDPKKGIFFAELHPDLTGELVDLARYVKEHTEPMMKLSSVRNWAVAGHIREHVHERRGGWNHVKLMIRQLRFATGVEDEKGKLVVKGIADHSKFKSRVLLSALEEIDKYTDLQIERDSNGKILFTEERAISSRRIIAVLLKVRLRPLALMHDSGGSLPGPEGDALSTLLGDIGITLADQQQILEQCDSEEKRTRLERNAKWMQGLKDKIKISQPRAMLMNYAYRQDIARMPSVAIALENPACRRNVALKELVANVLQRSWWDLTKAERGAIQEVGVTLNSDGLALGSLLQEYKALKKEQVGENSALQMLRDAATTTKNRLALIRGEEKIVDLMETTLFEE